MPSYVTTGASRGIGFGFLEYLASDAGNTVIGLVRDKATTDKKVSQAGLTNVTIIQADMTDRGALQLAAKQVAELTGGSLDVLINNAAYASHLTMPRFLDEFGDREGTDQLDKDLETSWKVNVLGTIYTNNAFLPLIKNGKEKKIITLSTGMSDLQFTNDLGIWESAPYSISKAATNIVSAKYGARYKEEGILCFCISPGVVDTNAAAAPGIEGLFAKFLKAAPNFPGPMTPLQSVKKILTVAGSMSVAHGDSGALVSEKGTKHFL